MPIHRILKAFISHFQWMLVTSNAIDIFDGLLQNFVGVVYMLVIQPFLLLPILFCHYPIIYKFIQRHTRFFSPLSRVIYNLTYSIWLISVSSEESSASTPSETTTSTSSAPSEHFSTGSISHSRDVLSLRNHSKISSLEQGLIE
jgi:hypothetical protein